MTENEACKVVKVLSTADGSCPFCVSALIQKMQEAFPYHDWKALLLRQNPEALDLDFAGFSEIWSRREERKTWHGEPCSSEPSAKSET